MAKRRYLFISGVARSGTSALTHLLNAHPEIVLGVERYKFLLMRDEHRAAVSPALFGPDRFLAWSPEDTSVRPRPPADPAAFRAKLLRAAYVGDKGPRLLTRVRALDGWFPGCRMIFIFRDPVRVAASWSARARNPADARWSAERDDRKAVRAMNLNFDLAARLAAERPDRFLPVCYEAVFDPADDTAIRALIDWLGLAYHPELAAEWEANAKTFRAIQAKPVAGVDATYLEATLDWAAYRRLEALAGRPPTRR